MHFFSFLQSGERVRLAYEKKCTQLKNQAAKGDEPSTLEKTRTALRDFHTQIKVSIHSIEAISKRIETLRDEELQPQLLELVQGYVTCHFNFFYFSGKFSPSNRSKRYFLCILLIATL